jgi:hypothetical protein
MQTFMENVEKAAKQGTVNLLFETAMYSLADELEQIARVLDQAGVRYEVIGGMAVNAHLLAAQQISRTFVTKDIDLLVQRNELSEIVTAAEAAGYRARKIVGGFMLIRPGQQASEAVHLVFTGERSKSTSPLPHPQINAEKREVFGFVIPVAALSDLVQMKLNSYRAKDLVNLKILDDSGMITPHIEGQLPDVLKNRLSEARKRFAEEEPDVE